MRINIIITVLFLHISLITSATDNSFVHKIYGNINLYSSQSNYVEELNKTLIIAQYAEILSKRYNYSEKIYLYFLEGKSKDMRIRAYFYDKDDNSDNKDGMNISFQGNDFDVYGSLNVIEAAIRNSTKLKKIAPSLNNLYLTPTSQTIIDVLHTRIYRPNEAKELEKATTYNYYYVDGKYHFFELSNGVEKEHVIVDNVVDFYVFNELLVIFTQMDEFKVVKSNSSTNNLKLTNKNDYYVPYSLRIIGDNKLLIQFSPLLEKNRVALYFLDSGVLIQDLDKFVENNNH